ncbi:MAG: Gfo/Idh/MocA family protein [Akkermansiaceae bacterium]
MSSPLPYSRRRFLTATAASAAFGPSLLRAAPSTEKLNIAFIGYGKRAYKVLNDALRQDDVQVVAICEVEGTRLAKAKEVVEKKYAEQFKSGTYKGCDTYVDYRELLQREDLDAVVIMTPDHMHVHPALAAAAKKLDIYCEKPLTQNIAEGRLLVNAVAKNELIFQTGSQQRSEFGGNFRKAVEAIWAGRIGDLKTVRIGVGASPKPCDLPAEEQPENVNWDLWLGPAPQRAYNEILCPKGLHSHFPAFRNYEEYAGGKLADMGAHHFDIAQWAMEMDASGPVSVEPPTEGNTGLKFTYANGVEMFHGGKADCTFEGNEGTIWVGRGELRSDKPEILTTPLEENARRVQQSKNHLRNWLDCIKSRKQPICTAEIGHRSASVCHLANIGYKLRRKLTWDPAKETFAGDGEANALRTREPRKGWEYA